MPKAISKESLQNASYYSFDHSFKDSEKWKTRFILFLEDKDEPLIINNKTYSIINGVSFYYSASIGDLLMALSSSCRFKSDNRPAIIFTCPEGRIISELWLKNNKPHREDGPAHRTYYPLTDSWQEDWYLEGKILVK